MEDVRVTWGQVEPEELERIVVLSPHFDDAAMGAGLTLLRHAGAATTVMTVFGGRPPSYPDPPSPWDALGGFGAGDDVVAARREEDRAAMAVLGADHRWLDFADHQYLAEDARPSAPAVAESMQEALLDKGPARLRPPARF